MRDSLLFQNGLYGKFHYCKSWKKVLTRIKESILNGEAKGVLDKYGVNLEDAQSYIKNELREKLGLSVDEVQRIAEVGTKSPFGFGNNKTDNNVDLYNDRGE